jgi:serine/threonine protein kinase
MWFEMVTATRPFEASTPFALAIKHVQDAPPRPNDVRPFSPIPSPVEASILRLMEKDPERRPQSAMALAGVIAHLIDIADHPPEPSNSTVRTVADLGHEQATETGFASFDSSSIPGLTPRPMAPPLTPPPAAAPAIVSAPPSSRRTATAAVVALAVVGVVVVVAAIMLSQPPSTPVTATPAPLPTPTPMTAPALPTPTLPPVPIVAPTPTPTPAPAPAPVSPIKKPPPKDKPKLLLD